MKIALSYCAFCHCTDQLTVREGFHRNAAIRALTPHCPVNHDLDTDKLNGSAQQQWHITGNPARRKRPSRQHPHSSLLCLLSKDTL